MRPVQLQSCNTVCTSSLVECFSQASQRTSINATTTVVEALRYFLWSCLVGLQYWRLVTSLVSGKDRRTRYIKTATSASDLAALDIDREFEFYEFFSFVKFNEFYEFFFG